MNEPQAIVQPGVGNAANYERRTIKHKHLGRKGDLTIELHYGDFNTGHGRQAALYVWRRGHETRGVYVPLSALWMYCERDAVHTMIPELASHLYGMESKLLQFQLMDAIFDYLGELHKSPPDPELFKDKSLDAFLESCAREGLDFFADVNGKRAIG